MRAGRCQAQDSNLTPDDSGASPHVGDEVSHLYDILTMFNISQGSFGK